MDLYIYLILIKNNLNLIVIDYLTLMQARGFSNKNLEVEYMANRLKALSKELNTCIVVLAQLSREVEKRADKRPILSDLRDSGGIEQARKRNRDKWKNKKG